MKLSIFAIILAPNESRNSWKFSGKFISFFRQFWHPNILTFWRPLQDVQGHLTDSSSNVIHKTSPTNGNDVIQINNNAADFSHDSDGLVSSETKRTSNVDGRRPNKPKDLNLVSHNSSSSSTLNTGSPSFLSPGEDSCVDWFLPMSPTSKQRVYHIPADGAHFQINNIRRYLRRGNRFVCTHYLYTKPKECCMRVKIHFRREEATPPGEGYIDVFLLVAPGVYDDVIPWPVRVEGSCLFLNQRNGEYSELFSFQHSISQPPEQREEISLTSLVSLRQKRETGSFVTFGDLHNWGHMMDNSVKLKWFVKTVW